MKKFTRISFNKQKSINKAKTNLHGFAMNLTPSDVAFLEKGDNRMMVRLEAEEELAELPAMFKPLMQQLIQENEQLLDEAICCVLN